MEKRPQLLELAACFCIGAITTERSSPGLMQLCTAVLGENQTLITLVEGRSLKIVTQW